MTKLMKAISIQMKFYEYHGYCTARVEEQRKCRNFAECKAGQGICKYSLLGGSCDWEPDTMDKERIWKNYPKKT